jgi:methionine-rich copper-binding protein CopC
MGTFDLYSDFSDTGTLIYAIDVLGDNNQDTSFISLDTNTLELVISSTNPLSAGNYTINYIVTVNDIWCNDT